MRSNFYKLSDNCIINLEDLIYVQIQEPSTNSYCIELGFKDQKLGIFTERLSLMTLEDCQKILQDFDENMHPSLQIC